MTSRIVRKIWGEAKNLMQSTKIKYPNNKLFGELELVDKEIFYISPNRRDN